MGWKERDASPNPSTQGNGMEGKGCRGDAPGCGREQGCSGGSPLARWRWPRAAAVSVPWAAGSRAIAWGGWMVGRRWAGAVGS